jgi:hypothetical protein
MSPQSSASSSTQITRGNCSWLITTIVCIMVDYMILTVINHKFNSYTEPTIIDRFKEQTTIGSNRRGSLLQFFRRRNDR